MELWIAFNDTWEFSQKKADAVRKKFQIYSTHE